MRCRPSLVRGRAAQVNPGGFTTPARRPSVPHRTAGCGKSSLRPLMAGSSPSLPDGSNPSAAIVQSASDVQCSRLLKTTIFATLVITFVGARQGYIDAAEYPVDGTIALALLQRLAAVRGRLSLCADQAAAAKWWLSMPMASVSAEGPMPKALSTRRTSPLMPGCRHQGRACPLRRARMTSNPLIVA